MTTSYHHTYEQLCNHYREVAILETVNSLLAWDERTMLPPAGGQWRVKQMTVMAGLIHQRSVDPRVADWLKTLSDSPLVAERHSDAGATIRQIRREYDKLVKLPQRLVEELTTASVLGQQAWVESRKSSDFMLFAPHLERIITLLREKADALGADDCRYDALLDEYEPDAKTNEVATVLHDLAEQLSPLIRAVVDSGHKAPAHILQRAYRVDRQEQFGRLAAQRIGFDFRGGRLDVTDHPFCSGMGAGDCRITTRYDKHFFPAAFFGILHEAGHGIYEQGLRQDCYGLPPGRYVSLGIHESQSRMWENHVGRSRAFWSHLLPEAASLFPDALGDVSLDDFYWAVNNVQPSLIRVEADEATYNLHIVIRFELERELIDGDLNVADLPAAWNERYERYLGIRPDDDANGVLQDIHWSGAMLGYFPTYSLGNLYASQLFDQAQSDLGDLDAQFARGHFDSLKQWLRTNVHAPGQCYTAGELLERITGRSLSAAPLLNYLRRKLARLYGLT